MHDSLSKDASTRGVKLRRLTDGIDYPCLDLAELTKRQVALLVMNEKENALASSRVSTNPQAYLDFGATYVIGLAGEKRCKIGYSNNPSRRIAQLQTALWDDVVCFGLFWGPAIIAQGIECQALRLAKAHDLRLRGEWVNLPPDEAVGLVMTAMDKTEAFCDSRTFMEHWAPHKEALYQKGGKLALALRHQASLDACRSGSPQPEPKGWLYKV